MPKQHQTPKWQDVHQRYNALYGMGLLPESAPMVEDIADFWCQYHVGKPLQEWLGTS